MQSININVGFNIYHITCTFMFRQVCTIEPSFFNATSGMHRRPFEGRHLVSCLFLKVWGVSSLFITGYCGGFPFKFSIYGYFSWRQVLKKMMLPFNELSPVRDSVTCLVHNFFFFEGLYFQENFIRKTSILKTRTIKTNSVTPVRGSQFWRQFVVCILVRSI